MSSQQDEKFEKAHAVAFEIANALYLAIEDLRALKGLFGEAAGTADERRHASAVLETVQRFFYSIAPEVGAERLFEPMLRVQLGLADLDRGGPEIEIFKRDKRAGNPGRSIETKFYEARAVCLVDYLTDGPQPLSLEQAASSVAAEISKQGRGVQPGQVLEWRKRIHALAGC